MAPHARPLLRTSRIRVAGHLRGSAPTRLLSAALAIVLAVPCATEGLHAQTRKGRTERSASETPRAAERDTVDTTEEPTDLAFRTLAGRDRGAAGRERSIAQPRSMTAGELHIVDTRRRASEPLVPLRGYPTTERATVPNRPGYAEASIGLDATARIAAGYSGSSWPFDYYGSLGFDISNGYLADNATRALSVAAGAGYIIDEGYGIFSGGHMGADARFESARYHLFALADSPIRTSSNWSIATTGANSSGGFTYDAGARYRSLGIDDDSLSSRETSLEGNLSLGSSWQGLTVGAEGDVRLTYLDGGSISFGRVEGFGSYSNRFLTARAGVQFSAGENSDGSTSGTIAPTGELRLFPLHGLTLIGTITGGLSPTTLAGLSRINPYLTLEPTIRQQRENIGYQVHVRIEPSRAFALRASAARSHYNDYAYFESPAAGRFAPQYSRAVVTRIIGDLTWRLDDVNALLGSAEFTEGTIDDERPLPFTPKWVADLLYSHRFDGVPLTVDAGARYIGPRPASDGRSLEQVVLVNLAARYPIAQRLDLTLDVRNLLDRRYQLWEGYDERGIFASIGASARF